MGGLCKFDVYGGCTSRDFFNYSNAPGTVNKYFARTSLVSQYGPRVPVPKNIEKIGPINFNTRCVIDDFNKSFRFFLRSDAPKGDYLIMDLLIERFNLYQRSNGYITDSIEFRKLKGEFNPGKSLNREERFDLFCKVMPKFSNDLQVYRRVFLSKALLKTTYLSDSNEILPFKNPERIESVNSFLLRLYDVLEREIPNIEVIETHDIHAWEGHQWGLTAYHYEQRFYYSFNDTLNQRLSDNAQFIKNGQREYG